MGGLSFFFFVFFCISRVWSRSGDVCMGYIARNVIGGFLDFQNSTITSSVCNDQTTYAST